MPVRSAHHLALGEAIRNRRVELGRSQEEVSLEVGMDRAHYSYIERGETDPKYSTLQSVASALDIPLWVLERDAHGSA